MKPVCIGIDIGGTNTEFGLITKSGEILTKSKIKTQEFKSAEKFIQTLSDEINKLLREQNISTIEGIGIGAPNANYFNGTIEFAPNLPWKGIIPLTNLINKYFDTKIIITNDANAAAIGEKIYGSAKILNDFIMITLGTGLGSGIFSNGSLIYGHDGNAGELGHTIYDVNGRLCGCGRRGCLETYVSATGFVRTAVEILELNEKNSILRNIKPENLSAKMIDDAAKQNDEIALETFEITGKILGFKLADVVAITSPEVIILFGGLAQAGELIINPTKKYMEQFLLPIFKNKVTIQRSELPENSAALLGAGALIWGFNK